MRFGALCVLATSTLVTGPLTLPVWAGDAAMGPSASIDSSPPAGDWAKDPGTAVVLSALAPVAVVTAGYGLSVLLGLAGAPIDTTAVTFAVAAVSPLLLGAGYVYGGDPVRGALVGAGWYGAVAGGFGLGFAVGTFTGGQFANLAYGFLVGLVAGIGYTGWALYDVHATTARLRAHDAE